MAKVAYKALTKDYKCLQGNKEIKLGETYYYNDRPKYPTSGYSFCSKSPIYPLTYYPMLNPGDTKIVKIEYDRIGSAYDEPNKRFNSACSDKIKIIEEVDLEEYIKVINLMKKTQVFSMGL